MENKKNNSEQRNKQRTETKVNNSPKGKQSGGIRCYGKAGFFAPETQPDGTVIQRFHYGREGD